MNLKNFNSNWKLNERITAETLRVLDATGAQLGVMSKVEALEIAKKQGDDLIEIVPHAVPPVAKIIEFGKFKYQEEKKKRESQKKSKPSKVKELKFTPFIGESDYQTRLKRIDEFLLEKNKVKILVYFQVKQLGAKSFGYDIMTRILKDLGEGVIVEVKPKFLGRNLIMTISPTNLYGKNKNQK
jgi:translation initiation factor IF-3